MLSVEGNSDEWVGLKIARGVRGSKNISLSLTIKGHPDLEEYMSNLANKEVSPVSAYGDLWESLDNKALEVYNIERSFPSQLYSLESVGLALLPNFAADYGKKAVSSPDLANISFLKLVGISRPEGVTVGIVGPYSADYIYKFKQLWPGAVRQFLQDYIVPITINLSVVSK